MDDDHVPYFGSSGPESYQGGRAVLAKLRAGRLGHGRFIQFPGTFVF